MDWREQDGLRWLEAELPGARAAFTTRQGGASEGPYSSLNLGLLTGDDPVAVRENRARVAAALGIDPAGVLHGLQVHGTELARSEAAPRPNPYLDPQAGQPPPADGQITARPGLTPMVQVADCLPLALAGPGGVAMVHCGWRGLAAGIAGDAAAQVRASTAAIGPAIGPCCYEVGEEVLAAFAPLGPGVAAGRMLDLPGAARRLLERAGVARVELAGLCTRCEAGLFFSHRRDGDGTGRQAGFAWLAGQVDGDG